MGVRWGLNRAGMINVFHYTDETLHFGGGRLLLRGVNGSGKSTAMNMLLPFLLDADTRRIDAAGEQSAVLRSWMLSGRDEQQPVGYLWVEFARGHEYLTCGCGIKANRSTDRVTTWWFMTDRRPHVDLALVENRVPLGAEALRVALGPHAVFAHDDRNGYRQAVRTRLFGGRDLDQHIRLLHIVRSPRVGDRIDTELTSYLHDALPQLSDSALDDAAQPLEDLDEHRRNVHQLTRTTETLDALTSVYRAYAALELRGRAEHLMDLCDRVAERQRAERRTRSAADAADAAREEASTRITDFATAVSRLTQEISALEASSAYQHGLELHDLSDHVATLTLRVDESVQLAEQAVSRVAAAEADADSAVAAASEELLAVKRLLGEHRALVTTLRLAVRLPDAPVIAIDERDGVATPVPTLESRGFKTAIASFRSAAQQRRADVAEVIEKLDTVDRLTRELDAAARERDDAVHLAQLAVEAFAAARGALDEELHRYRLALESWAARLREGDPDLAITGADLALNAAADLLDRRRELTHHWTAAADRLVDHHLQTAGRLIARRDAEAIDVEAVRDELAELERRTLPAPPSGRWQRTDRRTVLAEVIDFAPGLDDATRGAIEAAMEAAGLLGAEVAAGGGLHLATGELIVAAAVQAEQPLSRLVVAAVPEELQPSVDPGAVAKVLDSISTVHDSSCDTVITLDGVFRVGALHGRHAKPVAEHIGVSARRAALERRRADARLRLQDGERALASTELELAETRISIDAASALRSALPRDDELGRAAADATLAGERLEAARDTERERRRVVDRADAAHADAIAVTTRVAATHQLPGDRPALLALADAAIAANGLCDRTLHQHAAVERAHGHWSTRVAARTRAHADAAAAESALARARAQREPHAMRLATLQDTIGVEYAEVAAALTLSRTDLERTEADLIAAREAKDAAVDAAAIARAAAATATVERETAEAECVRMLTPMRRVLAVPGLLDAAGSSDASLPAVEESTAGVRQLAAVVLGAVAPPDREAVADTVRQSLRQRRDQLGAGWDAEDHQPDPSLPMAVQVTGPLGRMPLVAAHAHAESQLRQQSSLLTAKQDQALRNLLQGVVAREVAEKMHAAGDLVALMNRRLDSITTAHGIGVRLTWRRRGDLDDGLGAMTTLLAQPPDLRTTEDDARLAASLSLRIEAARRAEPERRYRDLLADVLDYRNWHEIGVMLRRPGRSDERLTRRTPLSEGEKKIVSYLPLFAAVAASYDALAEGEPSVPRFVLLDDAFAKVSEDNHAQLFGLLVELDLDFIATSERLWGTHSTVPELAITEVLRDADLGVIVLEHSFWNGRSLRDR